MEKLLSVPSISLDFFGLSLNPQNDRNIAIRNLIYFLMHNLILIIFNVISCIGLMSKFEVDNALGAASIVLLTAVVLTKYFKVYQKRSEVHEILESLQVEKFKKSKKLRNFKIFEKFLIVYTLVSLLLSVLVQFRRLLSGITPVTAFATLKVENIFLSLLIFSWGISGHIFGTFINIVTEILLCKITFMIALKFEEISQRLRELKVKAEDRKSEEVDEPYLVGKPSSRPEFYPNLLSKFPQKPPPNFPSQVSIGDLLKILETHSKLLDLTKKFKEICHAPFMFNIAVSAFIFGSLAFRVSIGIFPPGFLIYGLIFATLRTSIQVYFCQMLKDASEEVADAVYDCGWESFQNKKLCRKFVIFSMMRAQKSGGFKILNWIEINLGLLGKILQAAYSLYTLCHDLYD